MARARSSISFWLAAGASGLAGSGLRWNTFLPVGLPSAPTSSTTRPTSTSRPSGVRRIRRLPSGSGSPEPVRSCPGIARVPLRFSAE